MIETNKLNRPVNNRFLMASCLMLVAVFGCAGYQVGNRSLFRSDIMTVHVPVIQSDSLRRFMGERLTEAVITEIELRTPYKVVPIERAQSILQGRILAEAKRVLSESVNDDARNLDYDMFVEFSWTDRFGKPLTQRPRIRLDHSANFITESGQSVTTAQQNAIQNLARKIVNEMELW